MDEKVLALAPLVNKALDELYKNDQYLLEHKVHERSVVFRLAHYLQNLLNDHEVFNDYHLDVEYNRNGYQPKRISKRRNGARPDIIIHKRGSNQHNLLMIEIKPYWENNVADDLEKLKEFTQTQGQYRFCIGLSVILGKHRGSLSVKYVIGGEEIFNPMFLVR